MLIDTASPHAVTLESAVFDNLAKSAELRVLPDSDTPEQNGIPQAGRLSALRLGGLTIADVGVRRGARTSIGLKLLARLKGTLCLSTSRFDVRPGARFVEPDSEPWPGLQVKRVDAGFVVSHLTSHSPAEIAGLRKGQVLESIGGRSIEHLSVFGVEHHAAWNADRVLVKFRRDRKEYQAEILRPGVNSNSENN